MRRLSLCLLFTLLLSPITATAAAAEEVGEVVRHEGKVLLHRGGGVRGEALTRAGVPVAIGDVVVTRRDGRAWLLLGGADRVVMKEDSSLKVLGVDRAGMESGKVLFDIRTRQAAHGLQILTPTATIGVKGTRFAVLGEEAGVSIYAREGTLLIEAVNGFFRKQRDSLREEFEATLEAMRTEFEASREKMRADFEGAREKMRQGDFETVRSFEMEPGTAFGIFGREVRPLEFPTELEADFKLLDQYFDGE